MDILLLLSSYVTDDSRAIHEAASVAGIETCHCASDIAPKVSDYEKVCLYGDHAFAAKVSEQRSLVLHVPPDDFLTRLPDLLVRRELEFQLLERVVSQCLFYDEQRMVPKDLKFVKCAGRKLFKSGVFDLAREETLKKFKDMPQDIPVYVGKPVEWEWEARCFCLNQNIEALCIYARGHRMNVGDHYVPAWNATPEEIETAKMTATACLDGYGLPNAVVVDVGVIKGQGPAVLEANPAWGSGIYGCKAASVLAVVMASVSRKEDKQ